MTRYRIVKPEVRRPRLLALIIYLMTLGGMLWSCSDEDHDLFAGMRPSAPDCAVIRVKNEKAEFNFTYDVSDPDNYHYRVEEVGDSVKYLITLFAGTGSLSPNSSTFRLYFFLNELTQEIFNPRLLLRYNKGGIQYEIKSFVIMRTKEIGGEWQTHKLPAPAPVNLELFRFIRDPERKLLSIDFILTPDPASVELEYETTVTGSIKVNYLDYH